MIAPVLFLVAFDVRSGLAGLTFNSTCYFPPGSYNDSPMGSPVSEHTPCSPNSNDQEASACCGYSDGSICLSNGLCFVPANNTMLQGSCTDPTWTSPNCPDVGHRCVDNDLHICDSSSADVPASGDAGGLWYCGSQTQRCNETETPPFGIEPGFFADFRNCSSSSTAAIPSASSTAATASRESTAKSSGSFVTTDAAANATATPRTTEPSCLSQTDTKHTISGGDIAAILLGAFCAVLIALDIYMLFFRCRSGGSPDAIQKPMEAEQSSKKVGELDGNLRIGGPTRELPAGRNSHVELQ